MISKLLIPLREADLAVGVPLAFPVYDRKGLLLVQQGVPIASEQALRRLLDARPCRAAVGVERDGGTVSAGDSGAAAVARRPDPIDPLRDLRHTVEGVRLLFRLPGDREPRSAQVRFAGRLGAEALIVSAPHLADTLRTWHQLEGLALEVRITAGRSLYAFESSVLRFSAQPAPHLFLRYPDRVRKGTFRDSVRLETSLPATARLESGQQLPVTIVDLSGTGCAIDSEHLLGEVGAAFTLSFRARLAQDAYTLTVPVVVRNRPRSRAQGRMRYGLRFGEAVEPLDWHLRLAIRAFIYESLLAH